MKFRLQSLNIVHNYVSTSILPIFLLNMSLCLTLKTSNRLFLYFFFLTLQFRKSSNCVFLLENILRNFFRTNQLQQTVELRSSEECQNSSDNIKKKGSRFLIDRSIPYYIPIKGNVYRYSQKMFSNDRLPC